MGLPKTLGIFGFGYTAQHLATLLDPAAYRILATSRAPEGLSPLPHVTLQPFSEESIRHIYQKAEFILHSIPPDPQSEALLQATAHLSQATWFGYLSATSVYGDHQGAWVTETSVTHPLGDKAIARLAAETAWREQTQLPWHIFRLAGIYGPERNSLARLQRGPTQTIVAPTLFSRIHVTDIVRALQHSMHHPTPHEIYNLSDTEPATRATVDHFAAELLGISLDVCPLAQAQLSTAAAAFYQSSKRVSSAKFQQRFAFQWRYPTYREGLRALLTTRA